MSDPAQPPPPVPTGPPAPFRGCSACHQVFPENMLTHVGTRRVCVLCKEKATSEMKGGSSGRYQMTSYVPDYAKWSGVIALIGLAGYFAFRFWMVDSAADLRVRFRDSALTPQGVAPWVLKDPLEWPTLVAAAEARFRSSLFLGSSQGCFVQNEDGGVLGLTTVRLTQRSTVEPGDITPSRLAGDLLEWQLGLGTEAIKFSKMRPSGEDAFLEGVVILEVPAGIKTPAPAFTVRKRAYQPGARCFTISRSADGRQVVHRAQVLDSESAQGPWSISSVQIGRTQATLRPGDGSATRLHFNEPVRVSDVLGSPVVDSDGLLMAIITAPHADIPADAETRTFYAFGMHALRDAVNLTNSLRPMERPGPR